MSRIPRPELGLCVMALSLLTPRMLDAQACLARGAWENPFHYNCTDTSIRGTVQGESTYRTAGSGAGSESGLTISGIVVTAYLYNPLLNLWTPVAVGETDLTGLFLLPLTVYGTYRIGFEDITGQYQDEYWNDSHTFAGADNIVLNGGAPTAEISATLELAP